MWLFATFPLCDFAPWRLCVDFFWVVSKGQTRQPPLIVACVQIHALNPVPGKTFGTAGYEVNEGRFNSSAMQWDDTLGGNHPLRGKGFRRSASTFPAARKSLDTVLPEYGRFILVAFRTRHERIADSRKKGADRLHRVDREATSTNRDQLLRA